MSVFDGVLRFRGSWRGYQHRVLERAEEHLADGKVHIVAAPGSGKTTLGIELIRRLGEPCLVLAPTTAIRQQWLARVQEDFLDPACDAREWLSDDALDLRPITALTYQALLSIMDDAIREDAGASKGRAAAFTEALRNARVGTICVDEAHHLRAEWHRAIMAVMRALPHVKVVALTATPPYDSTPAQWKRYLELCGPIDEEISVPELVQEGSLCPHQDYVLLGMPEQGEHQALLDRFNAAWDLLDELCADTRFAACMRSHPFLRDPAAYGDAALENLACCASLLVFARAILGAVPTASRRLIGAPRKLPRPTLGWLEPLLQSLLFDDAESFAISKGYREYLVARVREVGGVTRGKVDLTADGRACKALASSRSKLQSIMSIVEVEHRALGGDLRMLVLCDHIETGALGAVGDMRKPVLSWGAVPLFEAIRRLGIEGMRIGLVCGSMAIVPLAVADELARKLDTLLPAAAKPLKETGYAQIAMPAEPHIMLGAITELFDQGAVNVLVGTRALLGEGWDAPCINALVLATQVGSFMLSNQMRGRAIRIQPGNPSKTSNIWHLACVVPGVGRGEGDTEGEADLALLTRRFDTFLGISCTEDVIESGIGRLGLPKHIISPQSVVAANERTLRAAADRDALAGKWERSLASIGPQLRIEDVVEPPADARPLRFVFTSDLRFELAGLAALAASVASEVVNLQLGHGEPMLLTALLGLVAANMFGMSLLGAYRLAALGTAERRLRRAAEAVLEALRETGKLDQPASVALGYRSDGDRVGAYLEGGSLRDKSLFADALVELLGPLGDPRYLLKRRGPCSSSDALPVPSIFGGRKEDAAAFCRAIKRAFGGYHLIYTRKPEGRRTLLKARWRTLGSSDREPSCRVHVAKGPREG